MSMLTPLPSISAYVENFSNGIVRTRPLDLRDPDRIHVMTDSKFVAASRTTGKDLVLPLLPPAKWRPQLPQ